MLLRISNRMRYRGIVVCECFCDDLLTQRTESMTDQPTRNAADMEQMGAWEFDERVLDRKRLKANAALILYISIRMLSIRDDWQVCKCVVV